MGTSRDVTIPVVAGEVLGRVANTAIDIGVNDTEVPPLRLHPEFYASNRYAAPLGDYYTEPLRSQLHALTLRDAEPLTGSMGYDVAGTLAGLWYLDGSDPRQYREDHAFNFGYHHILTQRSMVLDGLAFANRRGPDALLSSFWIKGSPRWESLTPSSGRLKFEMYQSEGGVVGSFPNYQRQDASGLDAIKQTRTILLVEMLDGETLRLERFDATDFTGIAPEDVTDFTDKVRLYRRNPLR